MISYKSEQKKRRFEKMFRGVCVGGWGLVAMQESPKMNKEKLAKRTSCRKGRKNKKGGQ